MRDSRVFGTGWLLAGLLLIAAAPALAGGLSFLEFEQALNPGVNGLVGAISVAVSPDGEHVYVAGEQDNAVSVWDRDPVSGFVSHLGFEEDGVAGVNGLMRPLAVTVSPDGACVYVAANNNEPGPGGPGSVVVFSRNPITGALTFVEFLQDGIGGVDGIGGANGVVAATGNLHVYVSGEDDDAVALFSRVGCDLTFVSMQVNGVSGVDGMDRPQALAISATGAHVYVTGRKSVDGKSLGTVVAFSRNPGTGALMFVEFEQDGVAGVERLGDRSVGLAVSPDGGNVYVACRDTDAVVAFTRNPTTGALTFLETERNGGLVKGLKGAAGITVSPNNAYVYVASRGDDAIAVFARDTTTGALLFLEVHDDPVPGTNVLGGGEDVAASSDGTSLYSVGSGPSTLVAFAVDTCGNGSVGIDEQCDDACLAGTPFVCEPADDGDGCSSTCRLELCGPTPATTCLTPVAPGGASLQIKDQADDKKDQLKLNWKGEATLLSQFGNPVTTASYVICVYDGSIDPQPLASRAATVGGTCDEKPCWSAKTTSYQYGDKHLTPNGLKKIQLKEGLFDGKAKIQFQGAGIFLDPPALPLTLPVTVQVRNTQTSDCWEAVYTGASKNVSTQECVGGANDGAACTQASECPAGACPTAGSFKAKSTQQCVGGANDGAVCTVASECPGGTCPL